MGKRCFIKGCRSNYDRSTAKSEALRERNNAINTGEKVKLFGFPPIKRIEERRRWIKAIPYVTETEINDLKTNPHVCIKHWPTNFPTIKGERGKERPMYAPSIFPGVPKSAVPTPAPVERQTKRCLFESRTRKEDELSSFLQLDRISFEDLVTQLKAGTHRFQVNLVHFCLSFAFFVSPISSFLVISQIYEIEDTQIKLSYF